MLENTTIKVILVDDHRIVRDGIKSLLLADNSINIIGEFSSFDELISFLAYSTPDIVILDISLPDKNGIEIAEFLNDNYPNIKILFLSMFINDDFIHSAIAAGASGYLPKNTSKRELLEAIHTVYQGGDYYSEDIRKILMKSYMNKLKRKEEFKNDLDSLSKREIEILILYAEGKSNQEIAEQLHISIRTVESHKNHIMTKLDLKSTVDMVKIAIKNKLINV